VSIFTNFSKGHPPDPLFKGRGGEASDRRENCSIDTVGSVAPPMETTSTSYGSGPPVSFWQSLLSTPKTRTSTFMGITPKKAEKNATPKHTFLYQITKWVS
jgi:hypothetical protein